MGPDPPRKSLCCALFSLPPPCWWSPHGAPPVRSVPHGTPQRRRALRLVFSSWRPGRTTTRGTPARMRLEGHVHTWRFPGQAAQGIPTAVKL